MQQASRRFMDQLEGQRKQLNLNHSQFKDLLQIPRFRLDNPRKEGVIPSLPLLAAVVYYFPALNGQVLEFLGDYYKATHNLDNDDERNKLITTMRQERARLDAIISSMTGPTYAEEAASYE
jgi:hypothetical protein